MKLSIISHPEMGEVRTTIVKGEPWFVAKDVCDILGIVNSRDTMSKCLDDDEKGVATIYTPGGNQEAATVNESGLYNLIFQSRKPEAKKFRKWVTSEVLPAIRKQGFYVHPSAQLSTREMRAIENAMRGGIRRYITGEDIYKCAKKFRIKEIDVRLVLNGTSSHNEVLVDLQERAIANQSTWVNALSIDRMQGVISKLNTPR